MSSPVNPDAHLSTLQASLNLGAECAKRPVASVFRAKAPISPIMTNTGQDTHWDASHAAIGGQSEQPVPDMTRWSFDPPTPQPSRGRRAVLSLVMFCIGVGATLAWQSYGDAARAMLADLSPQLGWLAPQTEPIAQTAPEAPAAAAASFDLQQLALDLYSVRRSVDQLASQFAASQQQMAGDIAKLQADEQQILSKLSAALPRPAPPARKPAPVTPSPSSAPTAQAR